MIIGFFVPRDQHHAAATRIMDDVAAKRWSKVHCSDYVIAEALNFLRGRFPERPLGVPLRELCLGNAEKRPVIDSIEKVYSGRWRDAFHLYEKTADRRLSFTDCTNLVIMREQRIPAIATFDGGFKGFAEVVDGY